MEYQQNTLGIHDEEIGTQARVMLVDDHTLTREALAEQVVLHSGWVLVAEAASGEEALEAVQRHTPDIVTMDMHMPGMNGIETTKAVIEINPSIKVLIISNYMDLSLVKAAFQAGANGYISKQAAFEELVPGIEALVEGKQYVCKNIKLQMD